MNNIDSKALVELIDKYNANADTDNQIGTEFTFDKMVKQTREWTTFYRRNIDVYITDYLQIVPIAYLQRQMLLTMADNDKTVCVCSREMGKSHITALFALAMCTLYSHYKVVITAMTLDQANKVIDKKIKGIFCCKGAKWSSPVLCQMVEDGYIEFSTMQNGGSRVKFKNGSWIEARPCIESTRGDRANLIIADEFALLKKTMYNRIIKPLREKRDCKGLRGENAKYVEEPKEILLTSARNKTNWAWKELVETVNNHYKRGSLIKTGFFLGDIYTAVANGINTKKQLISAKKDSDEYTWLQEYLNIWLGSSENSLFKYEQFESLQKIKQCFMPRTFDDFLDNKENLTVNLNDDIIRIMAFDVAVAIGSDNDNSAILFGKYNIKTNHLDVDYCETLNGMNTLDQVIYIKRMFYEYQADYIVMDATGVGSPLYDNLTAETFDEEYATTYPAWTINREQDLQIVSNKVLMDKIQRTVDSKAKEVIVAVVGTTELNTNIHLAVRQCLSDKTLNLLLDSEDIEQRLSVDDPKWVTLSSEQKRDRLLPHLTTRFMINEAVGLNVERRGANIKVIENANATKDLYMALAYLVYFAFNKLANRYAKKENEEEDEFDIDEWQCLASVNM